MSLVQVIIYFAQIDGLRLKFSRLLWLWLSISHHTISVQKSSGQDLPKLSHIPF